MTRFYNYASDWSLHVTLAVNKTLEISQVGRASVRRTYAVYYVQKSAAYAEITHQRRTADLVRPKMDIETSSLQKKPAHIYQITWFMSRLRIGNSFILFIDHARTSHLTDFESFIDSQCHV